MSPWWGRSWPWSVDEGRSGPVAGSELSQTAILRMMRSGAVDPVVSIGSCFFTIACVFGVPERLQISASELGMVIGSVCMGAASLRTIAYRSRR